MRAGIHRIGWGLTLALAVALAVRSVAAELKPAARGESSIESVGELFALLNEADSARRDALIGKAFTENAVLSDADERAEGGRAIAQRIEAIHRAQPGMRYQPIGAVARQHEAVHFAYEVVDKTGSTAFEGVIFALLSSDGRLARVDLFVGPNAMALP
jgi:hypothetical protein